MISKERLELVAPCGIDCGICELYISRDNKELYDYLVSTGIPKENLPCDGCRPKDGNCPVIMGECKTYSCVKENSVDFCSDCNDFPCNKLAPSADRANILPHNTKVFNLSVIKKNGLENFIEKSLEIKEKYYRGKMEIGNGPQLNKH